MQKWEYSYVSIGYKDLFSRREIGYLGSITVLDYMLLKGSKGWELVCTAPIVNGLNGKTDEILYTFKRPIEESEKS